MNAPIAARNVVLMVEDDANHRFLTRKALQAHGGDIDIVEVEDGEQALDYVYGRGDYSDRASFPNPGVILLDLNMPRMDGFEVLQTIKGDPSTSTIPIVVLTTSSREEEKGRSLQYGASAFITKPTDFAGFVEKMGMVYTILDGQGEGNMADLRN